MQSNGKFFCGDVVFDTINIPNRDEDSRLDQMYEKQISWDIYHKEFKCRKLWKKCVFKEIQHITIRNS